MLWFKESIKQCKKNGQTILIASHAISEIQETLTDYIILDKGILLEKKTMINFSKEKETISIKLLDTDKIKMRNLCKDNHLEYIERQNNFQILSEIPYTQLNTWISQYEVDIKSLSYEKVNLESHFLNVIREQKSILHCFFPKSEGMIAIIQKEYNTQKNAYLIVLGFFLVRFLALCFNF